MSSHILKGDSEDFLTRKRKLRKHPNKEEVTKRSRPTTTTRSSSKPSRSSKASTTTRTSTRGRTTEREDDGDWKMQDTTTSMNHPKPQASSSVMWTTMMGDPNNESTTARPFSSASPNSTKTTTQVVSVTATIVSPPRTNFSHPNGSRKSNTTVPVSKEQGEAKETTIYEEEEASKTSILETTLKDNTFETQCINSSPLLDDEEDFTCFVDATCCEDQDSSTHSSLSSNKKSIARFFQVDAYRRCAGCTTREEIATVWCCDCTRCLCTNCDDRLHDTDALDSLGRPLCSHRVEYIVNGGGVPVLSPLLELLVLFAALHVIRPLWTGVGTMLNVDYFFESVCPIVQEIRRAVFRLDHALYPVVRGHLGEWCDTEDAFVKIFTDLWVRGILTHTDSFALLVLKTPATIGALLVVLAVAPLLAIPYALVATIVRWTEITLIPNWWLTRVTAKLVRWGTTLIWSPFRFAGWCCRSTLLGLVMDTDFREYFHRRIKMPPKTGHRKRPLASHGVKDISIFGMTSRVTRVFAYFHRKARRAVLSTIFTVVFLAVALRVVLLSLPRCGNGLLSKALSKQAEEEMWAALLSQHQHEPPPQCVSVDMLARKLSERLGVQIPEFSSLGEEGRVLQKMQAATENDYIDDVLQQIIRSLVSKVQSLPQALRMVMVFGLVVTIFSGFTRRMLFWVDLRRRHRFHKLRKNRQEEEAQTSEQKSSETKE